MSCAAAATS